jgi:hypothetical protein
MTVYRCVLCVLSVKPKTGTGKREPWKCNGEPGYGMPCYKVRRERCDQFRKANGLPIVRKVNHA